MITESAVKKIDSKFHMTLLYWNTLLATSRDLKPNTCFRQEDRVN